VPSPYTLEDARAWIALSAVERERGSGLHLVVSAAEEQVAGAVALRLVERPRRHGEIGYWVAASARRTGVGTRAVRLLTQHAFDALGLPYVEIMVSPRNQASRALARRAGFESHNRELREYKGELVEFEIFRRPAEGERY
jgi:RimJ/RimL family protein N-acetyltransferase